MHGPVSTDGRQDSQKWPEPGGADGVVRQRPPAGCSRKAGRNSTVSADSEERARRPDSDEDWEPNARTEHRHASGEGERARGNKRRKTNEGEARRAEMSSTPKDGLRGEGSGGRGPAMLKGPCMMLLVPTTILYMGDTFFTKRPVVTIWLVLGCIC